MLEHIIIRLISLLLLTLILSVLLHFQSNKTLLVANVNMFILSGSDSSDLQWEEERKTTRTFLSTFKSKRFSYFNSNQGISEIVRFCKKAPLHEPLLLVLDGHASTKEDGNGFIDLIFELDLNFSLSLRDDVLKFVGRRRTVILLDCCLDAENYQPSETIKAAFARQLMSLAPNATFLFGCNLGEWLERPSKDGLVYNLFSTMTQRHRSFSYCDEVLYALPNLPNAWQTGLRWKVSL